MLFLTILSLLGGVSFSLLFYYQRLGPLDFWWLMALQILFFILIIVFNPKERLSIRQNIQLRPIQNVFLGLITTLILYSLFYLGFLLIIEIFPQTSNYVHNVYALKENVSKWRLIFLLGILIGPGEEILWRWFLQGRWAEKIGPLKSFLLIAFVYSLVHVTTGNPLLVLAALICGLFWGWLFFQFNSLVVNIISHSLWDVAIFVLWPIF